MSALPVSTRFSSPQFRPLSYALQPPITLHRDYALYDRATTVIAVRKGDQVAVVADGQVSLGSTVVKSNIRKVHRIHNGKVIAGFAGGAADAIALMEKLEGKLEQYPDQLMRACVELAKEWRMDKAMRNLDAVIIVVDKDVSLTVSGNGEVLMPQDDGIIAIGSGGTFALSAARALLQVPGLTALDIATRSMHIAADICVYTNSNLVSETLAVGASAEAANKSTDGSAPLTSISISTPPPAAEGSASSTNPASEPTK